MFNISLKLTAQDHDKLLEAMSRQKLLDKSKYIRKLIIEDFERVTKETPANKSSNLFSKLGGKK